jgi:hypothetical protein
MRLKAPAPGSFDELLHEVNKLNQVKEERSLPGIGPMLGRLISLLAGSLATTAVDKT